MRRQRGSSWRCSTRHTHVICSAGRAATCPRQLDAPGSIDPISVDCSRRGATRDRRRGSLDSLQLHWCLPLLAAAAVAAQSPAWATAALDSASVQSAPATIRAHAYTLAECLALADRNFPNLWAARARLAYVHAQLEEATWTPWFQWSAQSSFGLAPPLTGTVIYPQSNLYSRNITGLDGLQPFFRFGIIGVVPL